MKSRLFIALPISIFFMIALSAMESENFDDFDLYATSIGASQEYFGSISSYVAKLDCIEIEAEHGQRFAVPRGITLKSERWTSLFSKNKPIILPTRIAGFVSALLVALHDKGDLSRESLLQSVYTIDMQGYFEKKLCTNRRRRLPLYYASIPLPLHAYHDSVYQDMLISMLEKCTSHPVICKVLAYTLAKQNWASPYYPAKIYQQLLKNNAPEAATELARYSFLIRNIQLNETTAHIALQEPVAKNYYAQVLTGTTPEPLNIVAGSCTYDVDEYREFKPEIMHQKVVNGSCNLAHLFLDSVAGFARLPEIQHVHTLDLSHNYLHELPDDFFETLRRLRELNLSHNDFETLPPLQMLTNLQSLDLSHNQLTSLQGVGINQLTRLEHIDARNNLLNLLPEVGSLVTTINRARPAGNPYLTFLERQ